MSRATRKFAVLDSKDYYQIKVLFIYLFKTKKTKNIST